MQSKRKLEVNIYNQSSFVCIQSNGYIYFNSLQVILFLNESELISLYIRINIACTDLNGSKYF